MYDYFGQFINSNVNFLITPELFSVIEIENDANLNKYFNFFLNLFISNNKILMINRDIKYFLQDNNKYNYYINNFLSKDVFNNILLYNKLICKFSLFFYFNEILILLISCKESTNTEINKKVDMFYSCFEANFSFNEILIIKEINEYIKTLLLINEKDKDNFNHLIEFQKNSKAGLITEDEENKNVFSFYKTEYLFEIKIILLYIRSLYLVVDDKILEFIKNNK